MGVKKNPKSKALPFNGGDPFVKAVETSRTSHEVRLYIYEGQSGENHVLKEMRGADLESRPVSVSQSALLTEYKVPPESVIKSKLSVDLSPLLGRRVRLRKYDGCDASGTLVAISYNRMTIMGSESVVPVSFKVSGIGEIPMTEVIAIEEVAS